MFHGERVSFSGFGVKKGAFRGFESEKEKKEQKNENFVLEREKERERLVMGRIKA